MIYAKCQRTNTARGAFNLVLSYHSVDPCFSYVMTTASVCKKKKIPETIILNLQTATIQSDFKTATLKIRLFRGM
jgi:phosphoglycolate phosphatase-like HAD superfamily hydrolase